MPDDEGWLTHLSSGVMSHFQITSANLLHHKGKSEGFQTLAYILLFQFVWIADNRVLLKKVHLEWNEPSTIRDLWENMTAVSEVAVKW